MKIERIQSPSIGGSIPVLRRTDGVESDNGTYVGATTSDPHQKRGGAHYPPKEERTEKTVTPEKIEGAEQSNSLSGDARIPLLDITA